MISFYDYQLEAIEKLKTGSILCGGVGSGKSRTALGYYYLKVSKGSLNPFCRLTDPIPLYIITTAQKRNTCEWEDECLPFLISKNEDSQVHLVIDSWNNIKKYVDVSGAFFIFDEQRVVGSGTWAKSFIKIAKKNKWIMLTATPGDTWMDYVSVFIANGFYKNRTEFVRYHCVYSRYTKYPQIDHYIGVRRLEKLRDSILVDMPREKSIKVEKKEIKVEYDKVKEKEVRTKRMNPYTSKPIKQISEYCHVMRRCSNENESRANAILNILKTHRKVIIFYNFNYELFLLRSMCEKNGINRGELNGHQHDDVPNSDSWVYLVQYTAGAEGWNCIKTDTIIFYSLSYSYKVMVQSAGRIDRLNTPFNCLYYFYLVSDSEIDRAIAKALKEKRNFNEKSFVNS